MWIFWLSIYIISAFRMFWVIKRMYSKGGIYEREKIHGILAFYVFMPILNTMSAIVSIFTPITKSSNLKKETNGFWNFFFGIEK